MTPNGARRPLTLGARPPLPPWQVDSRCAGRRGVNLLWPVAAAALGRGGRLQRAQWRTGRLPHLAAPATLQPLPPQPPPRPPPGPQPAPLPRPPTPGLTPAGAAHLLQSTASQGQPQALSGFSANHVRSPARLRLYEPVSGRESKLASLIQEPMVAREGAGDPMNSSVGLSVREA